MDATGEFEEYMLKKAEEWLQEIAKTRPDHCSRCGAKNGIIPIIYGYPAPPLWELEKRGKVILAGC